MKPSTTKRENHGPAARTTSAPKVTIEGIVHCEDCALSKGTIRVREDLAVEVKRDWLLLQGSAGSELFPQEVRHLVQSHS